MPAMAATPPTAAVVSATTPPITAPCGVASASIPSARSATVMAIAPIVGETTPRP